MHRDWKFRGYQVLENVGKCGQTKATIFQPNGAVLAIVDWDYSRSYARSLILKDVAVPNHSWPRHDWSPV